MLKSCHRLSTKQFVEVMEKGKIYTSPLFVARVLENKKLGVRIQELGGISAVASKKVAPTAVMRNKLRRQIYSAVYQLQPAMIQGVSVIIFAKNETSKAQISEMTTDLKNLFSKAKISV